MGAGVVAAAWGGAGFPAVDLCGFARNFDAVGTEGRVSSHVSQFVDVACIAIIGLEVFVQVDDDGGSSIAIGTGSADVFRESSGKVTLDDAVVHAGLDGDSGFVVP